MIGRIRLPAAAPLQQAMYTIAAADQDLKALAPGGVLDEVPEQIAYPYVVLGEAIESPDNTHDSFGAKTDVAWHVWSDYRGMAEINTIGGRIQALFDHQRFDVPGHRLVVCRFKQLTPMRDPNPLVRHGIVRFTVVTEQL